jgi:hypothetical protein
MFDVWVALVVAVGGGSLGWASSRLPGRTWWLGYGAPLLILVAFSVLIRRPEWTVNPMLSWIWLGRWRLALVAGMVSMIFSTLMPRLPLARERRALGVLVVVSVLYFSVWPSLAVARSRAYLASLVTRWGPGEICMQSTDYTCGPAAAVTALRRLGFEAGEGELAVEAGTSPATGTPADVMAHVLNHRFGGQGLRADLRRFRAVEDLRLAGLTLVVVKFGWWVDHWLVVLEVTDREVVVADPSSGRVRMTYDEFRERWRFIGVTLRRGG